MPSTIQATSSQIDLSQRIQATSTVAASPSAATETVIGTLNATTDEAVVTGALLHGWAAFTVGTSGVSARLRIRKGTVSGTVVADSGATTVTATNLVVASCDGIDTSPAATGQTYVLTLTIASGAAASTVSALDLHAIIV